MITFNSVTKSYGLRIILSDVNLCIKRGEFALICGDTGSGKTTFLKLIYMEEKPTKGVVEVMGISSRHLDKNKLKELRSKTSFITQDDNLIEDVNVYENIFLPLESIGKFSKEKAVKLLTKLGILNLLSEKASNLSAGERRIIQIVRELLKSPILMLCDEPFAVIDKKTEKILREILIQMNKTGVTIVMTTSKENPGLPCKRYELKKGKIS